MLSAKQLFAMCDTDDSRTLTFHESIDCIKASGMPDEDKIMYITLVTDEFDRVAGADGEVDRKELKNALKNMDDHKEHEENEGLEE